jgi:hypothetical protein
MRDEHDGLLGHGGTPRCLWRLHDLDDRCQELTTAGDIFKQAHTRINTRSATWVYSRMHGRHW